MLNMEKVFLLERECVMIRKRRACNFVKIQLICLLFLTACVPGFGFQKQVVPVVDGHLGSCSAKFTVLDKDKVPVYDAKIDVELRHGFLGLKRMSLQVGTNSDGEARVAGLPDKSGKTYTFEITSGSLSRTVTMNTSLDGCKAEFEVVLDE